MINLPSTTKTVFFGAKRFVLPFRAHGYWVEDARGKNVAEAASRELATALAKLLNGTHNK
jgi:hypothetical protein